MKNIIDLTYDLEDGMTTPMMGWHRTYGMKQIGRIGFEGRTVHKIEFSTHTGTQIDAPLHFVENGNTIEQLPLNVLMGPVSIVDFSHLKPNEPVTKKMLDSVVITDRMIFYFDWQQHYGTKGFFQDCPYFSAEAAQYLVDKGVKLVGHDTPSPDTGQTKLEGDLLGTEKDSPIHKIFLRNNVVLVEYLANLDKIPKGSAGWNIIALPLRIKGADGSPARVVVYQ